jgi:hypothetical protein
MPVRITNGHTQHENMKNNFVPLVGVEPTPNRLEDDCTSSYAIGA